MKKNLVRCCAAVSVLGLFVAGPLSAEWVVDRSQSRIGFLASSRIHDVEGSFSSWRFDGRIGDNWQGTGNIVVLVSSVASGNAKRDAHLLNEDFFDAGRLPEAVFRIDSAHAEGDRLLVTGRLTLHGVERPLTLSLKRTIDGNRAELIGDTVLVQKDFGMNYDSFINPIKSEVRLTIRVTLKKQ